MQQERDISDPIRELGFAQVSACYIITINMKW